MEKVLKTCPMIRVTGTLLLPKTILRLKNLKKEQAESLFTGDFVAFSGEDDQAKAGASGLHVYGLLCTATDMSTDENNAAIVTARARERIQVVEISQDGKYCTFFSDPEMDDLSEQSKEDMLSYIKKLVDEIAKSIQGGRHIARRAKEYTSINQMISYLAQFMSISNEEQYELLAMTSQKERVTRFIDYLLRQKESISINLEMNEKLSKEASEFYRRQALQRQLEAIKNELHEEDGSEDEKNDYAARIQAAGMNETVTKSLLEDARRLETINPQSQDAEVLRTYLDFALSLPWKKEEIFEPDLKEARAVLDQRHAGLEKVKERILQHLAVMKLRKSMKGSAILLVGPPGTGKTSLGKSIAQALHRPYARLSLGGIRDESEIRGHRRTYVGAMSGRLLKAMKQAGTTNPVMILDELDKMMAGGFSGDPAAAMLEVLDPEQNDTFTDHYLDLPYDLSDVMFIATANSLDTIPAPLLDRMEIIQLTSYTPSEKFVIARDHLLPEVLAEHGIDQERLVVEDGALEEVINSYTMEAGCRGLKKQLAKIARTKAVDLIENENEPVVVKKEDLEGIFGPIAVHHEKVKDSNPCGVVTGLAWTAVGGEVLFIEAASMPGSGQMILTGQLGDVMKESARISYSVLKSRLPLDTMEFAKQDIHIHFPAGATPKDGPSAGITILTALASLALRKPVDSHIAMTGELSLCGDVLPIGGLKEKLFGAMRAGITKVLIPWDNQRDLEEVSPEVKEALTIVPVKTVEDVLKETLGVHLAAYEIPKLAAENATTVII